MSSSDTNWYYKIINAGTNMTVLVDCLNHYNAEYLEAKKDVKIKGAVEQAASRLPGISEERWSQLQELEAILNYFENMIKRKKNEKHREYFENYNIKMTFREAEKYADADPDVLDLVELKNEIALTRNKYLGILKSLEQKSFSLNNITKLRSAGVEDAYIDYGD